MGASLGFVYAPCAGPILAGVITVSASQEFTAGRLAVALAYAVGSAVVLYVLMLGGRRLTSRLSRHAGRLQMGMGAVMVVVAVLMFADYDTRFQTAIANDLPAFLVNPSGELEESGGVREQLAELRGGGSGGSRCRPTPARACPRWVPRRTSPATSAGSTRRAAGRSRSTSCAARSCWSTSGPTRASTASARFPT